MRKGIILLVLSAITTVVSAKEFVGAADRGFAYIGRISWANPDAPTWDYPGIQIIADFTGSSCTMRVKPGCGSFMVEIDDMPEFRIEVPEKSGDVTLTEGLPGDRHHLRLTYCIEGGKRHPAFYGLLLDDGGRLLDTPRLPTRKMEFIGNSITCGLGNMANGSEKTYHSGLQNTYYAYEFIATRELNAQCQVVARSGIGIYRNTLGKPEGDKDVLPTYYPYTLRTNTPGSELWDFNCYQPDVVCVNLGTNDTTNPKYYTSMLADAFKSFLRTLREKYPKAKIVLLTGTMRTGQRLADIKKAQDEAVADAAERGDHEIYRFDFTPDDGSLGWGSYKHPSKRRHEKMAAELVPFIRSITGWN